MFSGKNRAGIRRINYRIAALFSGLFALTSLLLLGGVYFTVRGSLREKELEFIRHKLLGYWAVTQTRDVEEVLAGLESGAVGLEGTPFFLRVSDEDNATVLFIYPQGWRDFFPDNLEGAPRNPDALLTLHSPNRKYSLTAAGIPLGDEYFLQVGVSTEQSRKALSLVVRNFSLLLLPLMLLSAMVGAFLTARTLSPIQKLAAAAVSIVDTGNLNERIDAVRARDELRDLVGPFNRMIEHIETVVKGMKGTLDSVAHDLRTPLTRFRGLAELALRGPEDGRRCREALQDGLEEADRILTLLNAVMDLSEAESGTLRLEMADTDLVELTRKLVDMYAFVAEERGVRIRLQGPETLRAFVDPGRFRRVVGNLLDNAVKYSPDGEEILVLLSTRDGRPRLEVRDRGPGIPAEDASRIWDRLYRGAGSKSKPGLGIGLSIARAITEAHGGSIGLIPVPGSSPGPVPGSSPGSGPDSGPVQGSDSSLDPRPGSGPGLMSGSVPVSGSGSGPGPGPGACFFIELPAPSITKL